MDSESKPKELFVEAKHESSQPVTSSKKPTQLHQSQQPEVKKLTKKQIDKSRIEIIDKYFSNPKAHPKNRSDHVKILTDPKNLFDHGRGFQRNYAKWFMSLTKKTKKFDQK